MSNQTIIQVNNVSKRFIIDHEGTTQQYKTLRDTLAGKTKKLFSFGGSAKAIRTTEEFWALKDISFEVKKGDRVGIIGRNGAGKSTLLKILSRITEPTTGTIKLSGRVASLLEVGTGFHPELTGRENIFLNGAILGMSRNEIKRKFDEIVDFSGVEKFLDTPVKRYSSGMYVRLAFAVAAHLEPEILVVDEVLAVGDAEFQKKCLGKMEDVSANEGRTVLLVSHNMGALRQISKTCILLQTGMIKLIGPINECINQYQNEFTTYKEKTERRNVNETVYITAVSMLVNGEPEKGLIDVHDNIEVKVKVKVIQEDIVFIPVLDLKSDMGVIYRSYFSDCDLTLLKKKYARGEYEFSSSLIKPLKKGKYSIDIKLGEVMIQDYDVVENCLLFETDEIESSVLYKSYGNERPGIIATNIPWRMVKLK